MVNIIVGYIRSPEGEAALKRAIEEARLRNGMLVVIHSMRGRESDTELLKYREELEMIGRRLKNEGVAYRVRELVRGRSPSDDMAELAKEEAAELIVIGLRRRSPVGKLVLGSNAQEILLHAPCPVLAVHARDGAT